MYKRAETGENGRLVPLPVFMNYIGMGRNKAMQFGAEIGARVEIGRAVRYDLDVVNKYLDDCAKKGPAAGRKLG